MTRMGLTSRQKHLSPQGTPMPSLSFSSRCGCLHRPSNTCCVKLARKGGGGLCVLCVSLSSKRFHLEILAYSPKWQYLPESNSRRRSYAFRKDSQHNKNHSECCGFLFGLWFVGAFSGSGCRI